MSDTNVSVQFFAETSDLIGKIAVAKVQVQQFSAEIKTLAAQMVATGTTGKAALGGIATDALTAKTSLASMEVELKGIGGATPAAASLGEAIKKTGSSAHGAGAGIAFYTREAHAMMDELSSGRIQQFQGTFLNVAFTFLQANTALIPFAAGILALGGTLAYVAYQAYAFKTAVESVNMTAAIEGFALTIDETKKLVEEIKKAANVSSADAEIIANSLIKVNSEAGPQLARMTAHIIPELAKAFGGDLKAALAEVAGKLGDLSGKGAEFILRSQKMTAAEKEQFMALAQSGQVTKAQVVALEEFNRVTQDARDRTAQLSAETRAAMASAVAYGEDLSGLNVQQSLLAESTAFATARTREQAAAFNADAIAANNLAGSISKLNAANGVAAKYDQVHAKIKQVQGDIELLESQEKSGGTSDEKQMRNLGLEKARDDLKKLQQQGADGLLGRDFGSKAQEQRQEIANTFKGSDIDKLKAQRAVSQAELDNENSTVAQKHAAEVQLQADDKAIREAGLQDFIRRKDMEVTAAGKSKAAKIVLIQEEVAAARAADGIGSPAELAALAKLETAKAATEAKGKAAHSSAARDNLKTSQEEAQGEVKAVEDATSRKIFLIGEYAKRGELSEKQVLDMTVSYLKQGLAEKIAILDKERQLSNQKPQEVQKILEQEKELRRKYASEVEKLEQTSITKTVQEWKSALDSLNSSITGQIGGLIDGTTNWSSALKNALKSMTTNVATFFTEWALKQAGAKALEMLGITQSVAATATGEAAKTTAVTTGATLRGAAETSAQSVGILGSIGNAIKSIASSVGITIAGVSANQAPITGPAAPAEGIAAGAIVSTAALGALGSYEVGAWNLSGTQLAMVHGGETIIPANIAGNVRELLSGGGAGGAGKSVTISPTVMFHTQAIDATSSASWLKSNSAAIMKAVDEAVRTGAHHGLRRLANA